MENEFIPYDLALSFKKLGFDEPCFAFYFKGEKDEKFNLILRGKTGGYFGYQFDAPLYQQAFKFIQEKYNLDGRVLPWTVKKLIDGKLVGTIVWYYSTEKLGDASKYKSDIFTGTTQRETELACLKDLVNIALTKRNTI